MSKVTGLKQIFSLLIQSSLAGLVLALSIQAVRTQLEGSDESPSSENCNELTILARTQQFETLSDFYTYYLCEHSLAKTKLLHFIGTFNVVAFLATFFNNKTNGGGWKLLVFAIIQGYAFAWISHFLIEENKPATFKYPVYSFISDFIMFKDIALGKLSVW